MKLDVNQFLKKIIIPYFEDPYYTNGSQLAQNPRKIWIDEKLYGMYSRGEVQSIHFPSYGHSDLKGLKDKAFLIPTPKISFNR